MSTLNKPFVVFDSRTAKKHYSDYNYARGSDFKVPGGCVAIVELTTHKDYYEQVTFTAIRTPTQTQESATCFNNCNIGKRYRRWRCCQSLGEPISGTNADEFAKSVVRWGRDSRRDELVEFEFITRPGNYYLITNKCDSNGVLDDCDNPTILEVTLVPVANIPELDLPCSCD